jgi:hypothetical protein
MKIMGTQTGLAPPSVLLVADSFSLYNQYQDHISHLSHRHSLSYLPFSRKAWDMIMDIRYDAIIVGDILEPIDLVVAEVDFGKKEILGSIELAVLISEITNINRGTPIIYIGSTPILTIERYLKNKGIEGFSLWSFCQQTPPERLDIAIDISTLLTSTIPKA